MMAACGVPRVGVDVGGYACVGLVVFRTLYNLIGNVVYLFLDFDVAAFQHVTIFEILLLLKRGFRNL